MSVKTFSIFRSNVVFSLSKFYQLMDELMIRRLHKYLVLMVFLQLQLSFMQIHLIKLWFWLISEFRMLFKYVRFQLLTIMSFTLFFTSNTKANTVCMTLSALLFPSGHGCAVTDTVTCATDWIILNFR